MSLPALHRIAARNQATAAQVALAWLLRQEGVIVIPKAGRPEHAQANRIALDLRLTEQGLVELYGAFPAPSRKVPLEVL